jgi:hypothetical protein
MYWEDAMGDEQAHGGSLDEGSKEVDRIREIIFGPQMHDYEQRFEAILGEVKRLQDAVERLAGQVSELDSSGDKKMQSLHRDLQKSAQELRQDVDQKAQSLNSQKVARAELAQMLINLGTQLQQSEYGPDVEERPAEPQGDADVAQ